MTKESNEQVMSNCGNAALNEQDDFDDTASTLYAASSLYSDNASTLYENDDDDTLTLVGENKPSSKQLSEEDLQHMRIVVVGLGITKIGSSNKVIYLCLLSVRTLIRKNNQDLINDRFVERFRIMKKYSELVEFDSSLRYHGYNGEPLIKKNIFCNHAPQMVDQRKILLELYFRNILNSHQQFKDVSHLVDFFDTDKETEGKHGTKEGYLTRKEGTMLFGKWIVQYFILKDGSFNYFDQKGGVQLGSIPLKDMSIGIQSAEYEGTDYRHGLVIKQLMNRRRHDGHMLCAYNDEDRDVWVTALSNAARSLDVKPSTGGGLLSKLSKKI